MVSVMGFSDLSRFDATDWPARDSSAAGGAFVVAAKRTEGFEVAGVGSIFFSHHIGNHHRAPALLPSLPGRPCD